MKPCLARWASSGPTCPTSSKRPPARGPWAVSRRILGTAVISGMVAATGIAIFIIPMLFVLVERAIEARKPHGEDVLHVAPPISANGGPEPAAARAHEG